MGAAFSRDLPGQSRLKTALTIQKQQIQNYKVSFSIRPAVFLANGGAETWQPTPETYKYYRGACLNFIKNPGERLLKPNPAKLSRSQRSVDPALSGN